MSDERDELEAVEAIEAIGLIDPRTPMLHLVAIPGKHAVWHVALLPPVRRLSTPPRLFRRCRGVATTPALCGRTPGYTQHGNYSPEWYIMLSSPLLRVLRAATDGGGAPADPTQLIICRTCMGWLARWRAEARAAKATQAPPDHAP